MNGVDTNIFLYSIDRSEPAKQLKAQQLLLQLHRRLKPHSCYGRCSANWGANFGGGATKGNLRQRSSGNIFKHFAIFFRWYCRLQRCSIWR